MAKKPAKSKPSPKKAAPKARAIRDASEQAVFNRGRSARKSGIPRDDSPYSGSERSVWQDGWDYQDKA